MAKHRAELTLFSKNREAFEEELLRLKYERERTHFSFQIATPSEPGKKQWLRNVAMMTR